MRVIEYNKVRGLGWGWGRDFSALILAEMGSHCKVLSKGVP